MGVRLPLAPLRTGAAAAPTDQPALGYLTYDLLMRVFAGEITDNVRLDGRHTALLRAAVRLGWVSRGTDKHDEIGYFVTPKGLSAMSAYVQDNGTDDIDDDLLYLFGAQPFWS